MLEQVVLTLRAGLDNECLLDYKMGTHTTLLLDIHIIRIVSNECCSEDH